MTATDVGDLIITVIPLLQFVATFVVNQFVLEDVGYYEKEVKKKTGVANVAIAKQWKKEGDKMRHLVWQGVMLLAWIAGIVLKYVIN